MRKPFPSCFVRLMVLGFVLNLAVGHAGAQTPTWQTAYLLPGLPNDVYYTSNRVVDAAGNIYATGSFNYSLTLGGITLNSAGDTDAYLAKFDSSGTCLWAVRAGGPGRDAGAGLALDAAGSIYVSGSFSDVVAFGPATLISQGGTDLFVAHLSATGAWLGATGAGSTANDLGLALALDSTGDAFVAGTFGNTLTLGTTVLTTTGTDDLLVARLRAVGGWAWAVSASTTLPNPSLPGIRVTGLVTDGAGNVTLAGTFPNSTLRFGATLLTNSNSNQSTDDGFVAQLSAAGQWRWARGLYGVSNEQCNSLAADASGNLYVCGTFFSPLLTLDALPSLSNSHPFGGACDGYVAMLTSTGTWGWALPVASTASLALYGLALDPVGGVYLTGGLSGTGTFGGSTVNGGLSGFNVLVAVLSPTHTWAWAVGSTGNQGADNAGTTLDFADAGHLIVTGYLTSGFGVFGADSLPSTGVFRARLAIAPLGAATDLPSASFSLVPNPTHHTATLTGLPSNVTTATLRDALGRVVRTALVVGGAATLNVRGLAAGLYFVQASGATRRLVVE